MRFGACIPNYSLGTVSATDLRDFCQECEGLGYDSLWVTDHVVATPDVAAGLGPAHFDPLTALMYAAAHTTRPRVGTSVLVVPYREPILAARILATVDHFSGGRLDVGAGAGWAQQEFAALGVPFAERGARTDEYLAVMKELWTAERPRFAGRFCRFEDAIFEPKPLQQPHPPIWVGGIGAPSLRRAARLGDGWHALNLYGPAIEPAIAEVQRQAAALGRPAPRISVRGMDLTFHDRPDPDRKSMQGTPAEIASDVAGFARLGFEEIVVHSLRVHTAGEALAPLRRFAREIMPRGGQ